MAFSHHKIGHVLLLIISITGLVGCTSEQVPASFEDTISSDEEDEAVVITFAADEWNRQLYEPLMDEFHTLHPDITVQFVAISQESTSAQGEDTSYAQMLASMADASFISGYNPDDIVYFTNLTPLIDADSDFDPADFWPAGASACQDDNGNQFGILANINVRGVFYDRQAFDEAQLSYPAPGWTWEDFQAAVTALAEVDGNSARHGYAERIGAIISPQVEALIAENVGEFDADTMQTAVQWFLDGVKAGTIRMALDDTETQIDWTSLFQAQNPPAIWAGYLGDMLPGSDAETMTYKEYGFAPYPVSAGRGADQSSPVWAQCLVISSASQNRDAAWQWLEFLSRHWLVSDSGNLQYTAAAPGRVSVADQVGYWEKLPADSKSAVRYILEEAGYASTTQNQTETAVLQALRQAVDGTMDFSSALQDALSQISVTGEGAETPVAVATAIPTPDADATVIQYYYDGLAGGSEAVKALADEYQQSHPDVSIEVSRTYIDSGGETSQVLSENFDCMTLAQPGYLKGFLPLDSLIEAEKASFLADFYPGPLAGFRQDGVMYGIPASGQPSVAVYNADLLAKRGLTPPSADWTFDDLVNLMTLAASSNEDDLSYGTIFSPLGTFLFDGRGATWVDTQTDPPIPQFDSSEISATLAWMDELIQSGVLIPFTGDETNFYAVKSDLQSGKIAFWVTMMGHLGEAGWLESPSTPLDFSVGVLPIPVLQNQRDAYGSIIYGHFISGQTETPQACWDWLKYLSEQPTLYNGVPGRISVAESAEWSAFIGEENAAIYRQAFEQSTQSIETEIDPYLTAPFGVWEEQVVMAMINGEDYTVLLPEIQRKAESYLACMTAVSPEQRSAEYLNCVQQADPDW